MASRCCGLPGKFAISLGSWYQRLSGEIAKSVITYSAANETVGREVNGRRCLIYLSGLLIFFVVYGVVQERVMTIPYGEVMYSDSIFLVFSNRTVAVLLAVVALRYQQLPLSSAAPYKEYVIIAACNFLSSICQYEALKYASFALQTLSKCGKTIPVILIGALLRGKRYSLYEYMCALVISSGCFVFMYCEVCTAPFLADSPFYVVIS